MPKKTKNKAWVDACAKAEEALSALIELQLEYQNDYDEMSDSQQESKRGEELADICNLDLEGALGTVHEANEVEAT
jgi:hypothetical protein